MFYGMYWQDGKLATFNGQVCVFSGVEDAVKFKMKNPRFIDHVIKPVELRIRVVK